ncbi:MAG TPA: ACT domain-containing protein [Alphaproteobacteria bacterium]|nr:ACT domain-containing protein [Alphaproteobacteria bacterium]
MVVPLVPADLSARVESYYLRFQVLDQPGVVADISAILRDCHVSLESVLQRGRDPGQAVQLIMTTHETREADMKAAIDKIAALASVMETPHMMRIEEFEG